MKGKDALDASDRGQVRTGRQRTARLGAGGCVLLVLALGPHAASGQGQGTSQGQGQGQGQGTPARTPAPGASAGRPAVYPPLRGALPGAQGVMRLVRTRGDVQIRPAASATDEAAGALPRELTKGDVLSVRSGEAELWLEGGGLLTLTADSQVEATGIASITLQRGELGVGVQPGREPKPIYIYGPPGSFPIKARDARVRLDGESLVITVADGLARLGSPSILWGAAVKSGEAARWDKGAPPRPAHPLLPAPTWSGASEELFLTGSAESAGSLEITLRWQPLPTAQRYRVELVRTDVNAASAGAAAAARSVNEVAAPTTELMLRGLDIGNYQVRVTALDDYGAPGATSAPHRLVVAQLAGLASDGTVQLEAGQEPQLSAPVGLPVGLLVDGAPPTGGLAEGRHKLQVTVGGVSTEVTLVAQARPIASSTPEPLVTPPPPVPAPAGPTAPPSREPPPAPPALPPPPEDVLLGGVGEVPFDGVRSPWAGRLVTARLESTMSGAVRLGAFGRFTFKNGLGIEAGVSLLRAAIGPSDAGGGAVGFGNITAAARSPALRRGRFALQALLATVAPLSGSSLDRAAEVDLTEPGGQLRPDVRPGGGGWRLEPAVLLGVRLGSFALMTTQGASLRLGDGVTPAYAGGLMLHADLLPALRLVAFSQWHVNYLGVALDAGDTTPDVGGAVGGGIEGLLGRGRRGQLRLSLLGRAGIGKGGAAVYGRGALGLQVGYRFN
ncbi:MAG: fibronectin type III domain-containing protein [Polyangia bacterium]